MSPIMRLWVIAVGAICAVFVFLGVTLGLMPQLTESSQIRSQRDLATTTLETQRAYEERLREIDQNSDEMEAKLTELQLAIPAGDAWNLYLQELQAIQLITGGNLLSVETQLASVEMPADETVAEVSDGNTDVVVEDVSEDEAAATTSSSGLTTQPVTIQVTGAYEQVLAFSKELQNTARMLKVNHMLIENEADSARLTVEGLLYVLPDNS